jgi:outer membrane protein OmpA-like peptidoglycan-associated protein
MTHTDGPAHLDVNVDHGHYVELLPLVRGTARDLAVTTIAEGQRRARIELIVSDPAGRHREQIAVVELSDLPTSLGRKPRMTLRGRITGRGVAEIGFEVEGKLVQTARLSVRTWLTTPRAAWAIPIAAVLVAALVLLGLRLTVWAPGRSDVPTIEPDPAESIARPDEETPPGEETRPGREEGTRADRGSAPAVSPPEATATDGADGEEGGRVDAAEPSEGAQPADTAEPADAAVMRQWTVYFLPDDPSLIPETRRSLNEIAGRLSEMAEEREGIRSLRIVGHCALAGTEAGRIELSQARAGNVWRHLRQAGVPQPDTLSVRGIGGQDPVTRQPDAQYLNRRVEIYVTAATGDETGEGTSEAAAGQ